MTISIKIVVRCAASLLLVTGAVLSTPAAALTFAEATKLCAKNPGCDPGVKGKDGSHFMTIKQADGHTSSVDCPAKGPCIIIVAKRSPGGGKPGGSPDGGAVGNVPGVQSSPAKGTGKTGAGFSPGKVTDVHPPASSSKEPKPYAANDHPSQQSGGKGK